MFRVPAPALHPASCTPHSHSSQGTQGWSLLWITGLIPAVDHRGDPCCGSQGWFLPWNIGVIPAVEHRDHPCCGSQGWSHSVTPLQDCKNRGWGPPPWSAALQQDGGELCWKGQHHSAFPVSTGSWWVCVCPHQGQECPWLQWHAQQVPTLWLHRTVCLKAANPTTWVLSQ